MREKSFARRPFRASRNGFTLPGFLLRLRATAVLIAVVGVYTAITWKLNVETQSPRNKKEEENQKKSSYTVSNTYADHLNA